jgi:hypothetical protein
MQRILLPRLHLIACSSHGSKPTLQNQGKKGRKLLPLESLQSDIPALERVTSQAVKGMKQRVAGEVS